jgi:uncharacterized protein (TIGR00730 family)
MTKPKSLCVYCGSSNAVAPKYLAAAFELGRQMGRAGIKLVYGGGRVGLMGRVADGVLSEGGRVIGIIPQHLHEREVAHDDVTELLVVDSMHERKRLMAEHADAFAILPGGFGTLDEMFEIVTWRQLGLHDKPILLVDVDDYWAPLEIMIERIVSEGFAPEGLNKLFDRVESVDAVLPALEAAAPTRPGINSRLL